MPNHLPSFLTDKLSSQYSSEEYTSILKGFGSLRKTSFRRNSLTISQQDFEQTLADSEIPFTSLPWYDCGYVSDHESLQKVQKTHYK